MFNYLKCFNFGSDNWIKCFYNDAKSAVINSGQPNFEGFKNILKQRKEIEHYNALSKDKLDYHIQKWCFLGTVL